MIESVDICLITVPKASRGAPEGLQSHGVNKIVLRCENSLLHAGFALLWSYSIIIDLICYFIRPVVMVTRPPPGAFDPTNRTQMQGARSLTTA